MVNWFDDAGFELSVLEGFVPFTDRIRLGRGGRDDDIEGFKRFLRDVGAAGIYVICDDWMAGIRMTKVV